MRENYEVGKRSRGPGGGQFFPLPYYFQSEYIMYEYRRKNVSIKIFHKTVRHLRQNLLSSLSYDHRANVPAVSARVRMSAEREVTSPFAM